MDATLRLQVIFGAIDKLTAPVRRLQAGAKGLSKDMAATQRTLAGLRKQEADLASYKGLEVALARTGVKLDGARGKAASLRESVAALDAPNKGLARSLAAAERAEKKAADEHERAGAAAQAMAGKLGAAGVEVERLADHEEDLADKIRATSKELERQQGQAGRMERFRNRGEALKSAGGKIAAGGAAAAAGVTLPVLTLLKSSIEASRESAQAAAQAQAAIKSMGNASGFTFEQLQGMAGKLQDLTLFDDDDILQKVTAQLLTFGAVSGKVFERAQLTALDMAQRLGEDPQSAIIRLGKALQDPVKGVTALKKVGVAFDEQQKKQIATMVKHGQTARAQGLILDELQKEFGGSAAAARAAAPDAAAQQSWRTFQETMGALAERQLPPLIDNVNKLLDRFNNLSPATQQLIFQGLLLAAALGPVVTVVGGLVSALGLLMPVIGTIAALLGVSTVAAAGIFIVAIAAVAGAAYLVYRYWEPIGGFFGRVWARITGAFNAGVAWLRGMAPTFATIGRMMLEGLLTALSPIRLVQHILKLGSGAVTALKGVLGIHSPSRVFASIGGHMMGGLALGLDQGATAPLGRLHRLGRDMTAATAAGALAASPVAGTGLPLRGAGGAGVGPGTAMSIGEVHIHIQQQPGQDARDLARQIKGELDELGRADDRRRRSSFEDDD